MAGLVTSFSVTVKVQVLVFPLPSLAVMVTKVKALCPFKTVEGAGLWVITMEPEGVQLSAALVDAIQLPTVPEQLALAEMFWFAGQVMAGA